MRMRTKVVVAGAAVAVVVVAGAAVVVARAVRRRRRRVLDRRMRKVMKDVLELRGEDFVPAGELGMSLFRGYIDKLDTRQLAALCALVEVGYFIKVSGIDPIHPDRGQIAQAVRRYLSEQEAVPLTREDLIAALDTSDSHGALVAAFRLLGDARI